MHIIKKHEACPHICHRRQRCNSHSRRARATTSVLPTSRPVGSSAHRPLTSTNSISHPPRPAMRPLQNSPRDSFRHPSKRRDGGPTQHHYQRRLRNCGARPTTDAMCHFRGDLCGRSGLGRAEREGHGVGLRIAGGLSVRSLVGRL